MWYDADAGSYFTQLTGQPPVEIRPTAPNQFEIVPVDATIVFEAGDPAPGFTLFQGGQEIHATRVVTDDADSSSAPEPWKPDAEALSAFEGRFFSDEIETYLTLEVEAPEGDDEAANDAPRLMLSYWRGAPLALMPSEPDTFTAGGMTLAFERDRNGHVIGFYVDATRSRDIRFGRVR
jgi:hypothetical protein